MLLAHPEVLIPHRIHPANRDPLNFALQFFEFCFVFIQKAGLQHDVSFLLQQKHNEHIFVADAFDKILEFFLTALENVDVVSCAQDEFHFETQFLNKFSNHKACCTLLFPTQMKQTDCISDIFGHERLAMPSFVHAPEPRNFLTSHLLALVTFNLVNALLKLTQNTAVEDDCLKMRLPHALPFATGL